MEAICGDYEVYRTLGEGSYGKVKLAKHKDGQYVALKLIFLEHGVNLDTMQVIQNEIEMMKSISHSNIINLIDYKDDATYLEANGNATQV